MERGPDSTGSADSGTAPNGCAIEERRVGEISVVAVAGVVVRKFNGAPR